MKIGKGVLAITKRLLKITEELSETARLCIEELEGLEAPPEVEAKKEVVVIPPEKVEPAVKPVPVVKEEAVIQEKAEPAVKPVPVVKEKAETEKLNYKSIIIPFAVFALVFFIEVLYFKIFVMHSDPRWLTSYIRLQHYFISFSIALAFAYGAFAFIKMRARSKGAVAGSAVIAFLIWFTSCCGAPMLIIILGLLGISFGATTLPPLVTFVITLVFISLGMIWLMRQKKVGAKLVCGICGAEEAVPTVHCGPGILGPEEGKLYCPCLNEGHTEYIEIPKHCEKPMKYVK